MKKERINSLTKSKEKFQEYVEFYYNRSRQFPNSSLYFHRRVIGMIRKRKHEKLFKNKNFLELVYATLSAWGIDRMDGKARLVSFEEFRKSIIDNLEHLQNLCKYKLHKLKSGELRQTKDRLGSLFENLKVMKTEARLVGVSKALHHLLPDLVMPIDRKHTLKFFYGCTNYNKEKEKQIFLQIFDASHKICEKLNLNERDLNPKRDWDTSIPKLIDNAIIGFVAKENKRRKVK